MPPKPSYSFYIFYISYCSHLRLCTRVSPPHCYLHQDLHWTSPLSCSADMAPAQNEHHRECCNLAVFPLGSLLLHLLYGFVLSAVFRARPISGDADQKQPHVHLCHQTVFQTGGPGVKAERVYLEGGSWTKGGRRPRKKTLTYPSVLLQSSVLPEIERLKPGRRGPPSRVASW